jgi:hypothetical protein
MQCGLVRSLHRKYGAMANLLQSQSGKKLIAGFTEWAIQNGRVTLALKRLSAVTAAITKIESKMPETGRIDHKAIERALTPEDLRCAGVFGAFLVYRGLSVLSNEERGEISACLGVDKLLEDIRGRPWEKDVRTYYEGLKSGSTRTRTRIGYIRSAINFLDLSAVKSVADLNQGHLDRYLKTNPGYRASLFPWVSFLNVFRGRSLSMPRKAKSREMTVNVMVDRVTDLKAALRNATSLAERRAILATLIAALYGVPLEQVLLTDQRNVEIIGKNVRIRLQGEWFELAPAVANIVLKIAGETGARTSEKIFPGRGALDGMSTTAARYHVKSALARMEVGK